jgi:hypothetical protein
MKGETATLLVHCRFPTGKGNRVRVVIDGKTAGGLDCPLSIHPGEHQVRVTSWGLPLCGAIPVTGSPGASVPLALQVCFTGFALGLVLFVALLTGLGALVAVLGPRFPGNEFLLVLAVVASVLASCLLSFYVLLPALSIYTFRLVEGQGGGARLISRDEMRR